MVVGGGVSGLVCAYALRKAGVDTLVVEASERAGGAIRTERREGYLLELGPQSFSGTAQMLELFAELGIQEQIVQAPAGAPRYVLVNGALRQVPMSPPPFLRSNFLSWSTKLAIFRDVVGKSVAPEGDESIAAFVRRKFSEEMLDRLVGPFVSGVYAGDPERLSLRSSFPTVHEAERRKGSVIRGLFSKAEKQKTVRSRQRPTLLSFRDGTQTFTDALATKLGDRLLLNASVTSVAMDSSEAAPTFHVSVRTATGERTFVADHLIVATPTDIAATLLRGVEPAMAERLDEIEYAPIAVVSTVYPRSAVGDSLHGFGFLVPRSAGVRTLGTVWNSSLFRGRAPQGEVLLTSFVGGATDPSATELSDEALVATVEGDLGPILKIRQDAVAGRSEPRPYKQTERLGDASQAEHGGDSDRADRGCVFSNVAVYPRALPQYNIGHGARLAAIERARARHSNLWLAGNYLRGPAIGACVEQSLSVAEEIVSRHTR